MMMDGNSEKLPEPLSAIFKDSFAYKTIKDRMPAILTKVADTVHRKKNDLTPEQGEEAVEDLKFIAGEISKLRYEIQTDKSVVPLQDQRSDVQIWNKVLENKTKENNGTAPKWFSSPWLYLECYMYRRIQQGIEQSKVMKSYDVFEEQKKNAFHTSEMAIQTLLSFLHSTVKETTSDIDKIAQLFQLFIQVSLWGNKCDLSISASLENSQTSCILDQLHTLETNIMVNDTKKIWNHLQSAANNKRIDIVLDNAGFELITDLCLAEFLVSYNLADTIHFHGKALPWFVSDVTENDFTWTLDMLSATNNMAMSEFGNKWKQHLQDGTWVVHFEDFWTTCFDFAEMKNNCVSLYSELQKAYLIIFKGDLNYRKLVGDLQWNSVTCFTKSLRGFHPAPLVTLRSNKSDVVVGLKEGQGQETEVKDKDWMVNGNWAVISFCDKY